MKKRTQKLLNFIKTHRVRLVLCGVLVLSLYVTPALTQAQYKWTLNGYSIVQAGEFYFDGNYMHDSSKNSYYASTGWDGKSKLNVSDIEIRNYDNALLTNKKDEDIYYKMSWSIETVHKDSSSTGDCTISASNSTLSDEDNIQIYEGNNSSTGDIIATGDPKKHTYNFEVTPPDGGLQPGDYVEITMQAENVDKNDNGYADTSTSFHRIIKATFRYTVSTADSYVESFDPTETDGDWEVKLKIGTGTLPDMNATAQTVYVWWDTDALEINPFNMDFSTASQQQDGYTTITVNDKTYGIVKFTGMGSNAIRTLDFYKKTYNDLTNTDVWFTADTTESMINRNTLPQNANGAILGFYLQKQLEESSGK